jgi:serine phosphatase RsbU (regulator of sigma subunit)
MSLFMLKTLGPTQEVQSLAFIAPLVAFWPLNRLRGQRRTLFIACLLWSMTELFYDYQGHLFHLPWTSPIQNFVALASLIVIAALVAIIFRDQRKTAEERAQLAGEMEAAREVQQQLVPASIPRVAGFQIDTAYLPAAEVGGDFYQVLLLADGATLIAVGDVSGKGLKAAMTGALAIGALRTLAAEGLSPDELLTRLNRQIVDAQNGGFITCLCLRVAADGAIRFANAGHIPPFLNGRELAVDGSLPLGAIACNSFPVFRLELSPGDSLTLISDGVIEAQNPSGELFGFERTAAISTQPAEAIAHAAQQFGQEDDITVLTLTFAPAGVAHA